MLMNIFSSFSPLNYIMFMFIFLNFLILNIFMFKKFKFFKLFILFKLFIYEDFKKINNSNLSVIFLFNLFFFNMVMNLSNLLPFTFCLNSQLNYFFFLSLILWFSFIIYSFFFYLKTMLSHFTPMGSPIMISPLLVIIEIISLLIRPITLSVRMSANLLAGHLLIHLLTSFSFFLMNLMETSLIFSMILMIMLNILEISVSIIQPYIFSTLLNMYMCENKN